MSDQDQMMSLPKRVIEVANSKAKAAVGRALRLPYADAIEHINHSRTGSPGFPFTISVSLSQDTARGGFQGMDITLGHDGDPAHAQRSVKLDPSNVEMCVEELRDWALLEYVHTKQGLLA